MKILVLGCNGQLGQCLKDQLRNTEHTVVYASRDQIDVTDFQATANKIVHIKPDFLINASALFFTVVLADRSRERLMDAPMFSRSVVDKPVYTPK